MDLRGEEREEHTWASERWRRAEEIWSREVDAAVAVEDEAEDDSGGGARVRERRE